MAGTRCASVKEEAGPFPRVVVFDLDNCCWDPEMSAPRGRHLPEHFTYSHSPKHPKQPPNDLFPHPTLNL